MARKDALFLTAILLSIVLAFATIGFTDFSLSARDAAAMIVCPDCTAYIYDYSAIAPNCLDPGVVNIQCLECGYAAQESIPATGHIVDGPYEGQAATCTTSGYRYVVCVVCSDQLVFDTLDAMGHDWNPWTTDEPTCTEEGCEYRRCARCDIPEVVPLEALGHLWGSWTVLTAPTTKAEGVEALVCLRNHNHVETRPIPRLHDDDDDNQENPAIVKTDKRKPPAVSGEATPTVAQSPKTGDDSNAIFEVNAILLALSLTIVLIAYERRVRFVKTLIE